MCRFNIDSQGAIGNIILIYYANSYNEFILDKIP